MDEVVNLKRLSSGQVRYVIVIGPPCAGKSWLVRWLKSFMPGWRVESFGDRFRKLFESSEASARGVEFDVWAASFNLEDKAAAHFEIVEMLWENGCVFMDMRYSDLIPEDWGKFVIRINGSIFERIAWSFTDAVENGKFKKLPFCGRMEKVTKRKLDEDYEAGAMGFTRPEECVADLELDFNELSQPGLFEKIFGKIRGKNIFLAENVHEVSMDQAVTA